MHARAAFALFVLAVLAGCGSSSSTAADPFRVLVTNDDGVAGEGLSVLVETLRANANVEVIVYAPATNQTGSGDAITTSPLTVMLSATEAGYPAVAVGGEPADCVLFALLQGLDAPPDLVVSGINLGQNIGEFVYLSGTVGAARWAARQGVPAIAVSLGFPATDYAAAAEYAARLVERFRTDPAFRRALDPPDAPEALILNVNYPTCTAGRVRGIEVVPVGRTTRVFGYTLAGEEGDTQTFQPQAESTSAFASDCTSTLTDPGSDIEAMANGFASVTPIGPDLTQETALEQRYDLGLGHAEQRRQHAAEAFGAAGEQQVLHCRVDARAADHRRPRQAGIGDHHHLRMEAHHQDHRCLVQVRGEMVGGAQGAHAAPARILAKLLQAPALAARIGRPRPLIQLLQPLLDRRVAHRDHPPRLPVAASITRRNTASGTGSSVFIRVHLWLSFLHGESSRARIKSVSEAARPQPGRLVSVGGRGVRAGARRAQTAAAQRRLLGLPLVPRDGARVLREPRHRAADERALRQHQGRPRGAPRRRPHLHERRAAAHRTRRLADDRVSHPRRPAVLRRHVLSARGSSRHAGLPARADRRRAGLARQARRRRAQRRRDLRPPRPARDPRRRRRPARRSGRPRRRGAARPRARRGPRRHRAGAEVPQHLGVRALPARRPPLGRRALRRHDALHAAQDGARRHLRSARRRVPPLLRRSALVGAALREDALRQRRQLVPLYLSAHQISGDELFGRIARETLDYVRREMRDPAGGFWSTQDADSEGAEGKFFLWDEAEVLSLLGEPDCELACRYWDVTAQGNFEHRNILHVTLELEQLAKLYRRPLDEAGASIARARATLFAAREQRIKPGLDSKVLTSWNGLMISAFAKAAELFDDATYRQTALDGVGFVQRELQRGERLLGTWKDGVAKLNGYLDDYAFFAAALVDVFEATQDRRHLDAAARLMDALLAHFWDAEAGGFFFTSDDHEALIVRSKPAFDGSIPSGNSVAAMTLLRLHHYLERADYRDRAEAVLALFAAPMRSQPFGFATLLAAVDFHADGPKEIAVVGDPGAPETAALLARIRRAYVPNRTLMVLDPGDSAPRPPLLEGKTMVGGKPTVYVCQRMTCSAPATTWPEVAALL